MRSTSRSRRLPAALAALFAAPFAGAQGNALPQVPPRFVPNVGQWDSPELYRVAAGGLQVFLEERGWSFWLREAGASTLPAGARPSRGLTFGDGEAPSRAVALRMTFVDAADARLVAEQELSGHSSYALGADRSRRRDRVPGFGAVRYDDLYDGVDVRVRDGGGQFEYDVLLEPDADLEQVVVRVDGATSMAIDAAGRLVLGTPLGDVVQPQPATWMVGERGERIAIPCVYELRGDGCFGFVAPTRDATLPLVVDPPIVYSTYVGGSDTDVPIELTEDASGRILVCGRTLSLDFPASVGAVQTTHGGGTNDGYVVCLDPSQPAASQVVFATYFGGTGNDPAQSVQVLRSGAIAFAGGTQSLGLPVTPGAYQPMHGGGGWDGYVGLLDPVGGTILALTYFGGTGDDAINGIEESSTGALLFSGNTLSTDLPVTANAFQSAHAGGGIAVQDGFVGRFDAALASLTYCSYLGGSGDEWCWLGDVDANDVLTLTGGTSSTDFPTTPNACDTTHNGGNRSYWWSSDVYVVQLDLSRSGSQQLVYGTFFGGGSHEEPFSLDVAPTGEILVSGTTTSYNLPVSPGAYQRQNRGGGSVGNSTVGDGFVLKLDPSAAGAAGLVALTYIGGFTQDQGLESTLCSNGDVMLVGWTQSNNNNFPTTPDALRRSYGNNDGYAVLLSSDLTQLLHSTLLGGLNSSDGAWLIHRHADHSPTVAGATSASDFPIVNGAQPTFGGITDTFVARMEFDPVGATRVGAPTPFPNGSPTIHALGDATAGNPAFGFACSQAEPSRSGLLLLSLGTTQATPVFGVDLWVDLSAVVISLPVTADSRGESSTTFAFPSTGTPRFAAQYVWVNWTTPLTLSASDAIQIN